ncbi:hypothetical protein [Hymenobacter sp. B81]|uniref:hypothetical protein n=1 Tax=Hymenobacter sp. B81 TaxID=3344878 RepID=UPI0037DC8684
MGIALGALAGATAAFGLRRTWPDLHDWGFMAAFVALVWVGYQRVGRLLGAWQYRAWWQDEELHLEPEGWTRYFRRPRCIARVQILSYRHEQMHNPLLLLYLTGGRTLRLRFMTALCRGLDYERFVLEAVAWMDQPPAAGLPAPRREATFFERPIATFVLVLFSAFMLFTFGLLLTGGIAPRGLLPLLMLSGYYGVFLYKYWQARRSGPAE